MSLDAFKNNAKVTVSLGYDNLATQIVLQAGDGNKLPAVPFNGEWWNSTDYTDPTDDPNKEIIRFTTQTTTDTFTIVRAQESTSAATHNTAGKVYKIVVGLTAKTLNTDIPATYTAYNSTMTTVGGVAYVSGAGTITEDNPNLHWDSANKRLGVLSTSPNTRLEINSDGNDQLRLSDITAASQQIQFYTNDTNTNNRNWLIRTRFTDFGLMEFVHGTAVGSAPSVIAMVLDRNGLVGIGTSVPIGQLHVVGPSATIIADGTADPTYRVYNNGTFEAAIGVPTTAGHLLTDSAINDLAIISASGKLLESVDDGVSVRRMIRPFKSLTNNTATTVFSLTAATNSVVSCKIYLTGEVINGTDCQAVYAEDLVQVLNHNGTITASVTQLQFNSMLSASSLTYNLTASSANPSVVQVTMNSGLTGITAGYPRVTITIENFTRQAIAPA